MLISNTAAHIMQYIPSYFCQRIKMPIYKLLALYSYKTDLSNNEVLYGEQH